MRFKLTSAELSTVVVTIESPTPALPIPFADAWEIVARHLFMAGFAIPSGWRVQPMEKEIEDAPVE